MTMQSFRLSAPFFVGTVVGIIGSAILLSIAGRRTAIWQRSSVDSATVKTAPIFTRAIDGDFDSKGLSPEKKSRKLSSRRFTSSIGPGNERKNKIRKVFIDCGANTASSVDLFLDTYPNGM